jgi:predicted CXXCH cytochrome family protein
MCGQCHTDEHHPTYDEWLESAHGDGGVTWTSASPPALRASCSKCHNGSEAAKYLDDPDNYVAPGANPAVVVQHTCAVCHDPHGNDNPGMLRNASVTDIQLPNNIVVEEAGAGRLCISCHNGRRTETDVLGMIVNGSGHFGPHHSIQGDMLKGVNAYETFAPSFPFSTSKHILVEDACVNCHRHPHEGDLVNGIPNFTGHTFEPTVEACAGCHGAITDFDQVLAKADFDGNGQIEGVQIEVTGLLELLEQTIIDVSATQEAKDALIADFEGAIGDTLVTTRVQREAGYNWAFVDFDGSHGVHNTTYSVQLLQQSILYLNPSALPGATILVEDVQ